MFILPVEQSISALRFEQWPEMLVFVAFIIFLCISSSLDTLQYAGTFSSCNMFDTFIIASCNGCGLSVLYQFLCSTALVVVEQFFDLSGSQIKTHDSIFTCVDLVHH